MQSQIFSTFLIAVLLIRGGELRPPLEDVDLGLEDEKGDKWSGNDEQKTKGYTWGEGWSPEYTEGRCRNALENLRIGLTAGSTWAFKIMDSSAFAPTGLLFGSTNAFGQYEECLYLEEPVWGKYCLAKIHMDWRKGKHFETGNIWNEIKNSTMDKWKNSKEWLHMGICLPSICSSDDAKRILSSHLQRMRYSLKVEDKGITVDEVSCRTNDPDQPDLLPEMGQPTTRGQLVMGVFIMGLLTTVIMATIYDKIIMKRRSSLIPSGTTIVPNGEDAIWERLLLCYSLPRNWRRLSRLRPKGVPPGTFEVVNGLKTATILLVVVGHRNFFSIGTPMFNTQHIENYFLSLKTALAMGGTILVDTFFFMSGCLMLYSLLDHKSKVKAIIVLPIMYIKRYIRLVPELMVIVAFYVTLLPRIGYGPMWEQKIGIERDNCRENWWANLLLLQAFVRPEHMCIIQSWYVAVEFHAFIICAPIALLFRSNRRLAMFVLVGATALSFTIPFVLTLVYHLEGTLMPFIPVLQDITRDRTFQEVYVPTYMRAAPYFIGMFCALAIRKAKKINFKLGKGWVIFFHVGSVFLCLFVCYSAWIFYRPEAPKSSHPLAAASYAVLSRLIWSLGIAWQVFAPATGHGWWVGSMLSWRPLAPLGRLSYGAFLTHAGIQLYDVSSMATPRNVSVFYLLEKNISDFVLSHVLAMILYLTIEAPIASLEKLLFPIRTAAAEGPKAKNEAPERQIASVFREDLEQSNLLTKEKYTPNESRF